MENAAPKKDGLFPEPYEEGATGKLDNKGAIFIPGGLIYKDQVHRAVLKKEGSIVVAKIQRPGIRKKIQADLDILESIAHRLHENSDDLRPYDLPDLVNIVRRNLIREIDFRIEAQKLRIARTFASETDVIIPEVYNEYCSDAKLV